MKFGVLLTLLFLCPLMVAQEAVDLDEEPHFHPLLDNDQVKVFALTLHSGESALVRLDHSFLTVALQDGEIIIWDEGKSPIQHFQVHKGETSFRCWSSICLNQEQLAKGLSGGFRNDRQNDYRNITVEFLDPRIGWNLPEGGLISPPASMYVGDAIVADVLLQPGEAFPAPDKPGAELLIPVTDVDLKGDAGHYHHSAGEVAWIAAEHTSELTNAGREAARFIVVEFRPGDSDPERRPRRYRR